MFPTHKSALESTPGAFCPCLHQRTKDTDMRPGNFLTCRQDQIHGIPLPSLVVGLNRNKRTLLNHGSRHVTSGFPPFRRLPPVGLSHESLRRVLVTRWVQPGEPKAGAIPFPAQVSRGSFMRQNRLSCATTTAKSSQPYHLIQTGLCGYYRRTTCQCVCHGLVTLTSERDFAVKPFW